MCNVATVLTAVSAGAALRWTEPLTARALPLGSRIALSGGHSLTFADKEMRYREVKGCQTGGCTHSNVPLPFSRPGWPVAAAIVPRCHWGRDPSGPTDGKTTVFCSPEAMSKSGCPFSGPTRASQIESGP